LSDVKTSNTESILVDVYLPCFEIGSTVFFIFAVCGSSEMTKWEDIIAQKALELLDIKNQQNQRKEVEKFCSEVAEQINKYKSGAKTLGHSGILSKHLLERASVLEVQLYEFKKLFTSSFRDTEESFTKESPPANSQVSAATLPSSANEYKLFGKLTSLDEHDDDSVHMYFSDSVASFRGPPRTQYHPPFSLMNTYENTRLSVQTWQGTNSTNRKSHWCVS